MTEKFHESALSISDLVILTFQEHGQENPCFDIVLEFDTEMQLVRGFWRS
jgi:hypothetical protein